MCTFWTGQIFSAIPWAQYIELVGNFIMKIIKQPVSTILGMVIDKGCQLICKNDKFVGCKVCLGFQYATTIAAVITDLVENTKDRFTSITFDLCKEAVKDNPSYSNINYPGQGKIGAKNNATA